MCVTPRIELPAESNTGLKPPDTPILPTELNAEWRAPETDTTTEEKAPEIPPKSFERLHLSDVQPYSPLALKARAMDEQKCLVSR